MHWRDHPDRRLLTGVVVGYWLLCGASLWTVYVFDPNLAVWGAFVSATVDTLSLALVWVVAWGAAARLPLTGPHAVRNLLLTLGAALLVLVVRIALLRAALMPLGWFRGLDFAETVRLMVPRNMVTFAVLWIGGWAFVHYRRSADRELRAATLRLHLMRARMTTLMSRLQPHFMGNALHAVSFLIYDAPAAARAMLADLRALIATDVEKTDAHEVRLEEELHFVEQWLAVQMRRFDDGLTCTVEAVPAARDAWVPRLILQPLVENVIKHAVGATRRPVHLGIRGRVEAGELVLTVEDDGPGLLHGRGDGVGLANSRDRLGVLYDGAAELAVGNRPDGGVSARVRLPLRYQPVLDVGSDDMHADDTSERGIRLDGTGAHATMLSALPATGGVAAVAFTVMALLLMAEELTAAPDFGWASIAKAGAMGVTRVGFILLPAAVAFRLPQLFPMRRGTALSTSLAAAFAAGCVLAGATMLALLARAAIASAVNGAPPVTLRALALYTLHLGVLLLGVLAAAYVARRVAEQDEQLVQLRTAEANLLHARRARMAASLEIEAVYTAFDRIEAAIGVDADAANRELTRLSERLSAPLRAQP